MSRSRLGRRAGIAGTAALTAFALLVSPAPADDRESTAPDRVYSHEWLGFTRMFDLVCEAALATSYELDAETVMTSLDPVTGTPVAGIDDAAANRHEWIDARVARDGAAVAISVEIRAADTAHRPAGSATEAGTVAVYVDVRALPNGSSEVTSGQLEVRYLHALDGAVERRIISSAHGVGRGPTPTPSIGPPLEPTPLGPPELAPPRPPTPGP